MSFSLTFVLSGRVLSCPPGIQHPSALRLRSKLPSASDFSSLLLPSTRHINYCLSFDCCHVPPPLSAGSAR